MRTSSAAASASAPASEQRPGLAGRDHRARDQHAAASEADVVADPLLGQRDRRAPARRRAAAAPRPGRRRRSRSAISPSSAAGIARAVEFWVHTTSPAPARTPRARPATSLSAITPMTPIEWREGELLLDGRAPLHVAPCGLCAASRTTVGDRRTISSRPGDVTSAKAACTTSGSSPPSSPLPPANASTAASAHAALCAWWAPYSGRKISSYVAAEPGDADQLPPYPGEPPRDAELESLACDRRADLGGPPQQYLGDVGVLLRPGLAKLPGLMMPAFSTAISAGVSPSSRAWSTPTGVITATVASATLVDVPGAAEADLEDRDVDRRVGERRERHRGHRLEERQRVSPSWRRPCRRTATTSSYTVDEALRGERRPVDRDPLRHRLEVGAGEPPGAQARRRGAARRSSATVEVLPFVPVRCTTG